MSLKASKGIFQFVQKIILSSAPSGERVLENTIKRAQVTSTFTPFLYPEKSDDIIDGMRKSKWIESAHLRKRPAVHKPPYERMRNRK
jgi:hypothetical protein